MDITPNTMAMTTLKLNASSHFVFMETEDEPTRQIMDIYFNLFLRGSIAVFGTVNNVINMIVFSRLGLKDSMSVGLMALSITDFLISFVCVSAITYIIWDRFFPDTSVDPFTLENVSFGWLRDLLFLCAGWITSLLSIERCVCVTFPFKVKQIFTRLRCIVAIAIIFVVHISVYAPIFASHWLTWTKVTRNVANRTFVVYRLVVAYSANRGQIMLVNDVVTGSVLPIPAQALVLISVVWMVHGLRMSSRVRMSASTLSNEEDGHDKKSSSRPASKLSLKENRLAKTVLLLAIIQTVCNLPRFMAVYAKQVFPDVGFGKKHAHVHVFMWTLAILACTINSSINIFVYLVVNDKYREKARELFMGRKYKQDGRKSYMYE